MDLLIVGASARAASQSALRAGFRPIAVDLFADRDLKAIARAHRVQPDAYPLGIEAIAARWPACPWIYTGALENWPDLIDRIAANRPLWGMSGADLRAVRDPIALHDALRRNGLASPEVRRDPAGLPRDGTWLVKPLASAGGRRIHAWTGQSPDPATAIYFQRRIAAETENYSSLYVGCRDGTVLLGTTRQILGRPHAPYAYRGSIGPISPVTLSDRRRLVEIGEILGREFGLRGLFGVDFVVEGGEAHVVEVNPRYTASVEVLELSLGRALLADHAAAFVGMSPGTFARRHSPAFMGKEILFAEERCRLPAIDARKPRPGRLHAVSTAADLPDSGTIFEPGEPILTVLGRGSTLESCRERLERRIRRWQSRCIPIPD